MSLRIVHACALNVNSSDKSGFDAFSANENLNIFALCDGANSCSGSGLAADWLSQVMTTDEPRHLSEQLMARHFEMCQKFPETGSTLLRVKASNQALELASIGDSFLWLFQKSWGGFAPWKCVETMPRDVDENGHPSQLVGSEVCQTIHVRNHDPKGLYCAVLMSDGPGLKTSEENLKSRLAMIGRNEPSQADLAYLCNSLAIDAQNSGCMDDTSVAMIWLKFR
jgi:hypothetical protein